jgi:hypothetical protein
MRFSSGLPSIIQGNFTWDTNYWQNSLAIPTAPFKTRTGLDNNGVPSLFANTNAVNDFADQYPGSTGARALVRLAGMKNFDIGRKSFPAALGRSSAAVSCRGLQCVEQRQFCIA